MIYNIIGKLTPEIIKILESIENVSRYKDGALIADCTRVDVDQFVETLKQRARIDATVYKSSQIIVINPCYRIDYVIDTPITSNEDVKCICVYLWHEPIEVIQELSNGIEKLIDEMSSKRKLQNCQEEQK